MKKISYNPESISTYNMENYCYEVARIIREKRPEITFDRSHNMVYPVWHYLFSGRASCEFCHKIMRTRPFIIANRILKGGSDDEIIVRIKTLLEGV